MDADMKKAPIELLSGRDMYNMTPEELSDYSENLSKVESDFEALMRKENCRYPEWWQDLRHTKEQLKMSKRAHELFEFWESKNVGDEIVLIGDAKSLKPMEQIRIESRWSNMYRNRGDDQIYLGHGTNRIVVATITDKTDALITAKNTLSNQKYAAVEITLGMWEFYKQMTK